MGTKSTLTDERREMAIAMAGRGWSDARIAEYIGVPKSTFATWRMRNHKGFATSLARAQVGMGDAIAKTVITAAMDGDMYACRYVLSRIFPDVWGEQVEARGGEKVPPPAFIDNTSKIEPE